MKHIQQLLTDLEASTISESAVLADIRQQLVEGNIQQSELINYLQQMDVKQKIPRALYNQIFYLIQSSNTETVLQSSKTVVSHKITDFSPTQLAPSPGEDVDKTKLASDLGKTEIVDNPSQTPVDDPSNAKTAFATQLSSNAKTELKPTDKTQVNLTDNTTLSDKTLLADDVTHFANDAPYQHADKTQIANNDATELAPHATSSNPDAPTVLVEKNTSIEQTQETSSPRKLEVGSVIKERFILKKVIGSGGMSVVFRALDLRKQEAKNHNPFVAIKVLGDTFKHHPLSLLALERETQKIQSLAHPNIITVYDFDRDGDNIYMTMECLEGNSLNEVIRNNKQGMPLKDALPIVQGMCDALIYAHSKDIIHSDFKPENVYYTHKKITKVLDFGIARAKKLPGVQPVDTVFDAGSLSALTPPYASLEMLQNKDPDPRDDIYALACVTYKLLTGKHPFDSLQADKAQQRRMRPSRIPLLNRRQWQALTNALAFDRDARTPSVELFLDGIMPKKRGWIYALAASIIIAIGIGGYAGTSITEKNTQPKIKLTQEQKNKIKNYLEIGELYYSLGYLATPPGDSALDQYDKVLAIDPSNKMALEGKNQLVLRYQELAETNLEQGDFEESLLLLETALLIEPDNSDLLSAQNKIKTEHQIP